jgi:hypothetical protein
LAEVALAVSRRKIPFASFTARELSDFCEQENIEIPLEEGDKVPDGADPRALWVGRMLALLFGRDDVVTVEDIRVTRALTNIERDGREMTLKTYEFVPLAELEKKGPVVLDSLNLGADTALGRPAMARRQCPNGEP